MKIKLDYKGGPIRSSIDLSGSKSISNRALLIRALCESSFDITNLSESDDTLTMQKLIESKSELLDAHHAGTTFRFLTAYHAFTDREILLTGSSRMQQRPIGPLVDALREIGANIEYQDKEGYPPIILKKPDNQRTNIVNINGNVSSQYLSALLMIGPTLPKGLTLNVQGDLVSKPYLDMTISMMSYFGVEVEEDHGIYRVYPQSYVPKSFKVESDWSSASYHYGMAIANRGSSIQINGVYKKSWQADAKMVAIAEMFGVTTESTDTGILITSSEDTDRTFLDYNFIDCPDIAQTIFVACAVSNVKGLFSGLSTLRIKETDRISASNIELNKIGWSLYKAPPRFSTKTEVEYYMLDGAWNPSKLEFDTYEDHRMAMAFSIIALKSSIIIHNADVVTKSYPNYWEDLMKLGFHIEKL